MANRAQMLGLFRAEDDFTAGRARRGGQAGCNDFTLCIGVKRRVQQLVKRGRFNPHDRFSLADETLIGHVNGNLDGRRRGALARPGLQHPQLAFLNGEFKVLHVAVMGLKAGKDIRQFLVGLRHQHFQRSIIRARLDAGGF